MQLLLLLQARAEAPDIHVRCTAPESTSRSVQCKWRNEDLGELYIQVYPYTVVRPHRQSTHVNPCFFSFWF